MLILTLIDVQYSQKAVISFEKGSNPQNHSSSSLHPAKKILPASKISDLGVHTMIGKYFFHFSDFFVVSFALRPAK